MVPIADRVVGCWLDKICAAKFGFHLLESQVVINNIERVVPKGR